MNGHGAAILFEIALAIRIRIRTMEFKMVSIQSMTLRSLGIPRERIINRPTITITLYMYTGRL